MAKITNKMKYIVSEGDIVTVHEAQWDYSKRIGEPFEAVVLWCNRQQPLITKLGEYKPSWYCYEDIVKIDGHINLDRLFDINNKE